MIPYFQILCLYFISRSFNAIFLLICFLLAVASHKYVIAFCVGLELHNADTPKLLYTVYMLIFSLMSPIGIAIGIAVTSAIENETNAYIITVGVLQVRVMQYII